MHFARFALCVFLGIIDNTIDGFSVYIVNFLLSFLIIGMI